jgi:hypothetical protein
MASRVRVVTALLAGLTTFGVLCWIVPPALALLLGWDVAAATYIAWSVLAGRLLDADMTAQIAVVEDPGRPTMDAILLGAATASVGAVVAVIATAGPGTGVNKQVARDWAPLWTVVGRPAPDSPFRTRRAPSIVR